MNLRKSNFKNKEKYRLSFAAGGSLYISEGKLFVDLFLKFSDWNSVLKEIVKENVLQFNSDLTTSRRARELCLRLKSLSTEELSFYSEADFQDQSILSWIALCRTYVFFYSRFFFKGDFGVICEVPIGDNLC